MYKELSLLFNSSGVNTDRTSHSWRSGCRLLAKTPTRGEREREKERRTASGWGGGVWMDEQVPMLLVSTDTGIGTCDHNFVTLACSDLRWHCTEHTMHTDTEWLVSQSECRTGTTWRLGRVLWCHAEQQVNRNPTEVCAYTRGYLQWIIFLISVHLLKLDFLIKSHTEKCTHKRALYWSHFMF